MIVKRVVLLFVAFVFFVSCSMKDKSLTFGFLIHSTDNSRWQRDLDYIESYSIEKGINCIVRNAHGDENVQIKQAQELLELGVSALVVVAANQNTAAGIVRNAHEFNVPVIAYDRLIKNSELDYLISFEYEKVGELLVKYAAERRPGANCVLLWGDANDANALFVKNGAEKALAELSDDQQFSVIYQSYIDSWKREVAFNKMTKVMDFSDEDIEVVIACNVSLALGTCKALADHGKKPGDVLVTGQDITIDFVESMFKNEMAMSITKPLEDLAKGAVDLVIAISSREDVEFTKEIYNGRKNVPARLFAPSIVDKNNYKEKLIGEGIFTQDQIDQVAQNLGMSEW